jgi:hypothetical protein
MAKPHLSFRTNHEVAEAVRVAAEEERRPVSQFLALIVEDALAARQTPREPITTAAA